MTTTQKFQIKPDNYLSKDEAKIIEEEFQQFLEDEFTASRKNEKALVYDFLSKTWEGYRHSVSSDFDSSIDTGVEKKKLLELGDLIDNPLLFLDVQFVGNS